MGESWFGSDGDVISRLPLDEMEIFLMGFRGVSFRGRGIMCVLTFCMCLILLFGKLRTFALL